MWVLVGAGGTAGTLIRAWLESAFPPAIGQMPWTTFGINVSGSFALGLLLAALTRLGPDTGWRRLARLGAGTGMIGGFTTYSTFAVESAERILAGPFWLLPAYVGGSVLLGVAAAAAGGRLAGPAGQVR